MTKVAGQKMYTKRELAQMLHDAEVRMQVLDTALRQIAQQPSDDVGTLQQIAATALEKAGEVRSAV